MNLKLQYQINSLQIKIPTGIILIRSIILRIIFNVISFSLPYDKIILVRGHKIQFDFFRINLLNIKPYKFLLKIFFYYKQDQDEQFKSETMSKHKILSNACKKSFQLVSISLLRCKADFFEQKRTILMSIITFK